MDSGNKIIDVLESMASQQEVTAEYQQGLQDAVEECLGDERHGQPLIVAAFQKYDAAEVLTKKARHAALRNALRRVTEDEDHRYLTCKKVDGQYVILATKRSQPSQARQIETAVKRLVKLTTGMDEEQVQSVMEQTERAMFQRFREKTERQHTEGQEAKAA